MDDLNVYYVPMSKQEEDKTIFYLAYGFIQTSEFGHGYWKFLGLRGTINGINDVVERHNWKYETIRVLKFDADQYGIEML